MSQEYNPKTEVYDPYRSYPSERDNRTAAMARILANASHSSMEELARAGIIAYSSKKQNSSEE